MAHAGSFPCCPNEVETVPIEAYFQNLKVGAIFSYSEQDPLFQKLTILEVSKTNDSSSILVLCTNDNPRTYAIAGISLNEGGYFIHFALGSYIKKDGADEAMRTKKELKNFWSDGYNGFR